VVISLLPEERSHSNFFVAGDNGRYILYNAKVAQDRLQKYQKKSIPAFNRFYSE
jgi:hypothetical protein